MADTGGASKSTAEPDIITAVRNNNIKEVRKLISKGTDVNALSRENSQTALMIACQNNLPRIVYLLLNDNYIDIDICES